MVSVPLDDVDAFPFGPESILS